MATADCRDPGGRGSAADVGKATTYPTAPALGDGTGAQVADQVAAWAAAVKGKAPFQPDLVLAGATRSSFGRGLALTAP